MMNQNFRRRFIWVAVILLTGFYCSSTSTSDGKTSDTSRLEVLGMTVRYPYPIDDPNPKMLDDSFYIYSYDGYVLYDMPNRYVDTKGDVVFTRMYFLYRKGDEEGYKIDTLVGELNKQNKVPRLQYLQQVAHAGDRLAATDSLVNGGSAEMGDESIRKYLMHRVFTQEFAFDTIYLHYSKDLVGVDYSLTSQFDTVPGRKLYKIRMTFHLRGADAGRFSIPASEMIYHGIFRPHLSPSDSLRITTYMSKQIAVL
jgi:hypothetical protein